MAQFARPISTPSTGGWIPGGSGSPATCHEATDDVTADGDVSYAEGSTTDTILRMGLGSVDDPVNSVNHVVLIRTKAVNGAKGGEKYNWALKQNTTVIASGNNVTANRGAYNNDVNYTLDAAEADAITDYGSLFIELEMGSVGSGEFIRCTQTYFTCDDAPSGTTFQENYSDAQTNSDVFETEVSYKRSFADAQTSSDVFTTKQVATLVFNDSQTNSDVFATKLEAFQIFVDSWSVAEAFTKLVQIKRPDFADTWSVVEAFNKQVSGASFEFADSWNITEVFTPTFKPFAPATNWIGRFFRIAKWRR